MWRYDLRSRTPHGVRGLKCELIVLVFKIPGRTPHGVRGLKSCTIVSILLTGIVAPLTGCVD